MRREQIVRDPLMRFVIALFAARTEKDVQRHDHVGTGASSRMSLSAFNSLHSSGEIGSR